MKSLAKIAESMRVVPSNRPDIAVVRKIVAYVFLLTSNPSFGNSGVKVKQVIDDAVGALMTKHKIAGMAVGIVKNGEISTYQYGFASKDKKKKVTDKTLFEIGSISKTLTGTLAAFAITTKKIAPSDKVSSFYSSLKGGPFDKISVLNLATYTSGGLPLQTPSSVLSESDLMVYFKNWKPSYSPGSHRIYSNPSIALLGRIAAKALKIKFDQALVKEIFNPIGMRNSFLSVPKSKIKDYAWGYREEKAIRMTAGILAPQSYGIRTTIGDLTLFVRANIEGTENNLKLNSALASMKKAHHGVGPMIQCFVWEKYPYPTKLEDLLEGNSRKVIFKPLLTQGIDSSAAYDNSFLFNKTGSTNGFGAYVLFVPKIKIGIVLLANKNYSIKSRVSTAHKILKELVE